MESPPPSTLSPPPPWLTNTNYTLRGYTHGLFCDIYIRNGVFLVNMRQKLITLDPTSWDLAAKKPNFSQWVRDMLRSERNKRETSVRRIDVECVMSCGRMRLDGWMFCRDCLPDELGDEEE